MTVGDPQRTRVVAGPGSAGPQAPRCALRARCRCRRRRFRSADAPARAASVSGRPQPGQPRCGGLD
jgi:hypothetical protein